MTTTSPVLPVAAAQAPRATRHPLAWVPTLYLAMGLPNVMVGVVAAILYKNLGVDNETIALYTSQLYLPWVLKPLWAPLLDRYAPPSLIRRRGWMRLAQIALAPALLALAFCFPASAVDVQNYLRANAAANSEGGGQTCFGLAGAGAKYRLGNECEVWSETEFKTVVYAGNDGAVATAHFMPTVYIPTTYNGYSPNNTVSSPALFTTSTGSTVSFPNLYVDLKGVPWLFGGTVWAGTRYYKRESVYINDFFYWNPSGVGAGLEDINIGRLFGLDGGFWRDFRVSYGAFAVDGQPSGLPQVPSQIDLGIRHDLQLRGLTVGQAEFQLGVQVINDWSNDKNEVTGESNTHGGWGVTGRWIQKFWGGDNKLVAQYGRGGGTGFGTLARF